MVISIKVGLEAGNVLWGTIDHGLSLSYYSLTILLYFVIHPAPKEVRLKEISASQKDLALSRTSCRTATSVDECDDVPVSQYPDPRRQA